MHQSIQFSISSFYPSSQSDCILGNNCLNNLYEDYLSFRMEILFFLGHTGHGHSHGESSHGHSHDGSSHSHNKVNKKNNKKNKKTEEESKIDVLKPVIINYNNDALEVIIEPWNEGNTKPTKHDVIDTNCNGKILEKNGSFDSVDLVNKPVKNGDFKNGNFLLLV